MQKKISTLKPIHYGLQSLVGTNLRTTCSYWKEDFKKDLVAVGLKNKVKVSFFINELVSIDKLVFKQIVFTTEKIHNPEVQFSTDGFIVEHLDSKKCFGVL